MKKILTFCTILFIANFGHAWTLVASSNANFASTDVDINVATSACSNAGFTTSSMQTLVTDSIDDFWGKVPTSALKLNVAGTKSVDVSGDDLTAAANKATNNTILVGCSSNATLFASSSTLAVGGISCANGICKAAVLLNDTATTQLDTLDRQSILTTFAHELGHALGLGHSSQQLALMYYSLSNKSQKALSQDDMDGISYLYPNNKTLGGVGGACGTIDTNPNTTGKNKKQNFIISLLIGIAIVSLFRRFSFRLNF